MAHGTEGLIIPEYWDKYGEYFAKGQVPRILAYVEGLDDENFWRELFLKYSPIDIGPTANKGSADGKEAVLRHLSKTGKHLILCLDSDLSYLLPNHSSTYNTINNHICILKTYAYAIENYLCYANGLNELCKKITSNYLVKDEFDFVAFFHKFSKKIYEPFTRVLYYYYINNTSALKHIDFNSLIRLDGERLKNITNVKDLSTILDNMLDEIEYSLIDKVIDLTVDSELLKELIEQWKERGIDQTTSYLFVCGHTLFGAITKPLVEKVVDIYKRDRIAVIRERCVNNPNQSKETTNHYEKIPRRMTIGYHLKTNTLFHSCYLIEKIKRDILTFVERYHSDKIKPMTGLDR